MLDLFFWFSIQATPGRVLCGIRPRCVVRRPRLEGDEFDARPAKNVSLTAKRH